MPIPRPYQLSNGIFVPINIENGHGRLCPLFWGCTLLLLICGHIYIQTSSALQCQNHISNIYFVEVWQENGEEAYQKVPLENIIPHICHFFSTGSNFLHTIARKSRQNNFATKQRKSLIMKEISDFSPHLSCGDIWNYSTCGEISDFSTFFMLRNVKLLHMWRHFRFLHICHVKLIHMWWNFRLLHICHV